MDSARINLAHLNWLRREVKRPGGKTLSTWQIYAAPQRAGDRQGPYRFVGDEDEGIGCVDDVARAAIVYMGQFRQTGERESLVQARRALEFVRALAAGDGTYYNFIWANGQINRKGPTSRNGLNWWTARALWATAEGARFFAPLDPAFARALQQDARRTVAALRKDQDAHYGRYTARGAVRVPAWFMGGAADVTAVAVLGLGALYQIDRDRQVGELMGRYAAAIAAHRLGDRTRYPYNAHMPSNHVTHWHAYGAHMLHALALAGRLLKRPDLIDEARREADHFTIHLLLAGGPIAGFTPAPRRCPQIAYNVEPQVSGLLALFEATGDARYGKMAGLFGSWLRGNNPAGRAMLDAPTGRVWDGIDHCEEIPARASQDSGAESTIEGLLAEQSLAAYPRFRPYADALEILSGSPLKPVMLEAEAALPAARAIKAAGGDWSGEAYVALRPNETLNWQRPVAAGEYLVSPIAAEARWQPGATLTFETGASRQTCSPPVLPTGAPWFVIAVTQLPQPVIVQVGDRLTLGLKTRDRHPISLDGLLLQPVVQARSFWLGGSALALDVVRNYGATPRVYTPTAGPAVTIAPYATVFVDHALPPSTESGEFRGRRLVSR